MNVHTPELASKLASAADNQRLTEVVKAARTAGVALSDIRAITDPLPQLRDRTLAQIDDAIAKVQALHDPDAALLAVNDAAPETQPALGDMLSTGEAKSELHMAALGYIAKGYRIIPIVPGKKTPLLKDWHANALETAEAVDAFWSKTPDANLAVCPDDLGLAVVEQDPGGNVAPLNLPATFKVQSPRGGIHYYFRGSLPPSASKLGDHIDTRGRGSYVLIPPSIVDGKTYSVVDGREPVPLPAEIEAKLAPRAEAGTSEVHELDLPANIGRAKQRVRDLIARNDVAVEGRGGDNRTYQLACELVRDLALSKETALPLLLEWNEHCVPPWSPEELEAKVMHAAEYGQNEAGTYAVAPASEVFKDAPLTEPATQKPERARELPALRPIPFADLLSHPVKPVEEIIPGLIEKGIATMLSGPGGTHKSRIALQLGLCIQAGLKVFGKPTMPATFVYLDYENGEDETARRVQKMRYSLKLPALKHGHYHDYKTPHAAGDGPVPPYEAAPALATVTDDGIRLEPMYYALYSYLRSIPGHKFVVLDSCYNVLRFVGQTKINETAVKAALNLLDHVCAKTNSTILYLWHPSQAGMERGDASGWSVAWHNTPRARLSMTGIEKEQFDLKVEKRNNGPTGEVVTLHWTDGVLLPITDIGGAEKGQLFFEACIKVAYDAALAEQPITQQRKLYDSQIYTIERAAGFKPKDRQVKEQLALAVTKGRLRYVGGYGKQRAGYYPVETDPHSLRLTGVDTFAAEKQRERASAAKASEEAASKEVETVPAHYSSGG